MANYYALRVMAICGHGGRRIVTMCVEADTADEAAEWCLKQGLIPQDEPIRCPKPADWE